MEKSRISFYDEIKRNKRNSIFLALGIFILLILLTTAIAFAMDPTYTFLILIVGTIFSLIYVVVAYSNSAKIALASVGAKPASQSQYKMYHDLVENMCLASGLPKPKLYIMNDPQINAFATGKDPEHAVLCFTTGALEKLNKQELEGVIAHEMSHVANYDIRFMTTVAVVVGLISIISQIFLRSLWFSSGRDRDKNNTIFLIIAIVLAILTPILVAFVQLAVSRKREYVADSTAVKFTRSPTGLIGALKKIKSDHEPPRSKVPGAVAPLFIRKPSRAAEWFSTHPPLEKRIKLLEKM